jgi:hypothetical protein
MGRKRDTARRRDNADQRRGGTGMRKGGDNVSWTDVNFTGSKNKENLYGRFNWYK